MEAGTAVATDWITRKRQMRDRPPRRCEVPGCYLPADRVGSQCVAHRRRTQDHGHPTAGRVTTYELRPWTRLALDFLERNQDHAGVVAGIEFLERLVRIAPDHEGRVHRHTKPSERVERFLSHLRRDAIDVRNVIAVGIACELHRMQHPKRWPDATHSAVQFGHEVLAFARTRVRSGASIGRTNPAQENRTPAFVKEVARQMRDPLLPLYVKAAQHLHQQIERTAQPVPAAALTTPFVAVHSGPAAEEQP